MLASVFIIIWTTVAGFAVGLLPDYHLSTAAMFGFHQIMASLSMWSLVLPIEQALTVIITIIIFEITVISLRLFVGIVALMRGSGKPEI